MTDTTFDLYASIKRNIASSGFHSMGVFSVKDKDDGPSFLYTVGLAERDLPEFLVIGFDPRQAHGVVSELIKNNLTERGTAFSNGEVVELKRDGEVVLTVAIFEARASVKDTHTIQVGRYYNNEDYRVQQVVIIDENGNLPNAPDAVYNLQTMLASEPVSATNIAGLKN